MNRQPYPEVAEAANPCTADAPKLEGAEEDSHVDQRKSKPLETPTAADGSNAEPVKARVCDLCRSFGHTTVCVGCMEGRPPVKARLAADGCDDPALHDTNVQQALDNADGVKDHQRSAYPFFEMRVLAAEVRRLREEVAKERGEKDAYWRSGERMVAKLARVEALIADERRLAESWNHTSQRIPSYEYEHHNALGHSRHAQSVVNKFEATLRDEPQPEREHKLPYNGY